MRDRINLSVYGKESFSNPFSERVDAGDTE
jgi:hypothetical protein